MGEEKRRIEALTEVEREALRAYLTSSEVKEVARVIGRSPAAIEQRLARARRKLGVRRSIDAAHMLGRVESRTPVQPQGLAMYGSPVYATTDIAEDTAAPFKITPAEEGDWRDQLPFPTKGRPWNDSSVRGRLIAILVGVMLATASALMATSLLEVTDHVVRQLL